MGSDGSSSRLTLACVVARLPAVTMVIDRSPGVDHVKSWRPLEKLSTPALVRVSDMKIKLELRRMPTQYVIGNQAGSLCRI